jgi:hypothetical protein
MLTLKKKKMDTIHHPLCLYVVPSRIVQSTFAFTGDGPLLCFRMKSPHMFCLFVPLRYLATQSGE